MTAVASPQPATSSLGIARGGSALVTGASSGIGETFARTLAARGVEVLLTAAPQEAEQLERLADELSARHGIRAFAVPVDLSDRDGPDRVRERADELAFEP